MMAMAVAKHLTMLSAYLAAKHGGRSETSVVAFPPPWRRSTYYGSILTMALYLLWLYTYYGSILTTALYLLRRSTYYGALHRGGHQQPSRRVEEHDAPHHRRVEALT